MWGSFYLLYRNKYGIYTNYKQQSMCFYKRVLDAN